MQNEPVEVTFKVTAVFENFAVPYLIGGSLASTLHEMARTTQDSDIVAEMRLEHLRPFVSVLQDEFYIDEEMIVEAIQHFSSFNIIHHESMFKVDVFTPRPRPFLQSQLARARRQTFAFDREISARFASPAETILSQPERHRMGGDVSDGQWRDIPGLLRICSEELDCNDVRRWPKERRRDDLPANALREAE